MGICSSKTTTPGNKHLFETSPVQKIRTQAADAPSPQHEDRQIHQESAARRRAKEQPRSSISRSPPQAHRRVGTRASHSGASGKIATPPVDPREEAARLKRQREEEQRQDAARRARHQERAKQPKPNKFTFSTQDVIKSVDTQEIFIAGSPVMQAMKMDRSCSNRSKRSALNSDDSLNRSSMSDIVGRLGPTASSLQHSLPPKVSSQGPKVSQKSRLSAGLNVQIMASNAKVMM